MDEKLIADLDNLHALCAFAYEQGFHELGYDPVASVADEIDQLRAALVELLEQCDDYFHGDKGFPVSDAMERARSVLGNAHSACEPR